MSAISVANPKAEYARAAQALAINVSAARGIAEVMKSNLGPKGTMKMLVSGAGEIKITKDGNVLLHEMQIQHPSASLIAKASTAHDDIIGDGTTSIVLLIAEIMKQADLTIGEGIHPRVITDGLTVAKTVALDVLDLMKIPVGPTEKEVLLFVARTALRTKVDTKLADILAEICTEAVVSIHEVEKTFDLHMVEIMEMQHRNELETCLVKGIVMDHGGRHPEMPKKLVNCYILTCNISLEYEKTEVNSGFFYKSAEDREALIASEREFIEERVKKIIDLKKHMCPEGSGKTFVVINQKGIDPLSLDMMAKEGILALRRAKRRNMERLSLACGGMAMNSVENMTPECLGYAGLVYEHVIGENKYTFVEECRNPKSVTIVLKAQNKHSIVQMKDAVRDGLRSLLNVIQDGCVVPGAGAYELAVSKRLSEYKADPRHVLGVKALCEAVLIIPKTLVANAGYDAFAAVLRARATPGDATLGLDLNTGETFLPTQAGIYDNYSAKKQMIDASIVVATNLLLTDEIMRAGLSSLK